MWGHSSTFGLETPAPHCSVKHWWCCQRCWSCSMSAWGTCHPAHTTPVVPQARWQGEMWLLLVALCLAQGLGDAVLCVGPRHDNPEQFMNIVSAGESSLPCGVGTKSFLKDQLGCPHPLSWCLHPWGPRGPGHIPPCCAGCSASWSLPCSFVIGVTPLPPPARGTVWPLGRPWGSRHHLCLSERLFHSENLFMSPGDGQITSHILPLHRWKRL